MHTRHGLAALLLVGAMACSRNSAGTIPTTQQFTRQVDATPTRVITAASAVFGERGIGVATMDETKGDVVSVPLSSQGTWGNATPEERIDCPAAAVASTVRLRLRSKAERNGSVVSLEAERIGAGCVLRSQFVTQLLDDIIARAKSGT